MNFLFQSSGKYPHVIVSAVGKPSTTLNKGTLESVVQFGPAAVGTTALKTVELHNLSPVRNSFSVGWICIYI